MIWVSGSIARDLIMDFPGRFADHIDPKKIHVLSISFVFQELRENIGGTAANIVYNLSLLKERPELIGSIGTDKLGLLKYFKGLGVGTKYLTVSKKHLTGTAYIITDRDDNQINGFYKGAMAEKVALPNTKTDDWGIVAANEKKNMIVLSKLFAGRKMKYIFDPGQAVFSFSKRDLEYCVRRASILMGNDYEIALIRKKTKMRVPVVVKTLGPKGSQIEIGNQKINIGIAKPKRVVDPTGAGDAYRAGFLKGMILGYNLETCGRLGATIASFAVEKYATQNHKFSLSGVRNRYNLNFREKINEI